MSCVFCAAEWPHILGEDCDGYDPDAYAEPVIESGTDSLLPDSGESGDIVPAPERRPVGRPPKADSDLEDPVKAGRKRAAAAAPINPGMVCEWTRLANAGGGVVPIQGCVGFPATDRHHGPDKSTLNNELGVNLHRICSHCHNRWHVANDPYYGTERPADNSEWVPEVVEWRPHDPHTKMTMAEALAVEASRQQEDRRGK